MPKQTILLHQKVSQEPDEFFSKNKSINLPRSDSSKWAFWPIQYHEPLTRFPATCYFHIMAFVRNIKIEKKQPNSRMCFVCGLNNSFGLKARFYEIEGGKLIGVFTPAPEHQGYPGRLHGGVAASILDETLGRAVLIENPDKWWVTMSLELRFRLPVPLEKPLKVIGQVDIVKGQIYEASGHILMIDGRVAISAKAKFLTQKLDDITRDENFTDEDWYTLEEMDDPVTISVPGIEK